MTPNVRSACGRTRLSIDAGNRVTIQREGREQPYCRDGQMKILVRSHLDPSEPAYLALVRTSRHASEGARLFFSDSSQRFKAVLTVAPSEEGVLVECEVRAPSPVWIAEWSISGIHCNEMLVPALGGQALSASMPPGTILSFKYPFWWSAQLVVARSAEGGLFLEARETDPRLKLLRVGKAEGDFTLTYGVEAQAPIREDVLRAAWILGTYDGDWKVPAERHRIWMEQAFQLKRLEENELVPEWFKHVTMVLELWGMRKDRPRPHHTFAEMEKRLTAWSALYDPASTLVYLPGFAEHGIDSHAPDYEPGKELGGASGFRSLLRTAHRLGFRVMIHTNVLAMTFTHRRFREFRRHQVVDVFGRPQSWGLDMDGDWLAEPYFAYINPGARAWGELMARTIRRLVKRFTIDAVFLDQTLLAFNTSRGPNFISGMRTHIRRLQQAMPGILFGGEGLHEQVASVLPMAQLHGIDSIAEVHGLDSQVGWRSAHPISTFLFSPYTKFTAHLLTRHPSDPRFAMQEEAYTRLGALPALCLYDAEQPMDTEGTRAMIARAKGVQSIPEAPVN